MKVLFISTEDVKYGAPKSMQKLIQTLRSEHNIECVLLTKKHNLLNDWCDEQGIENYSFKYRDIMASTNFDTWWLNVAKHINKYVSYIIGCFTQKKINRLPIDFAEIDFIHSNSNRVDIGVYISRKYNITHIWHLREMDEGTKNILFYHRNCVNYMNESADCFIAITKAVKNSWVRHGLDEKKIRVVYNGIDPSSIVPKKEKILTGKIIKIVAVGRIERVKGQMDIVNALCDMPEEEQKHFQLDFIGDAYADYKRLLIKKIKKSMCKANINFLGYCKNVSEMLQDYDIGITCSEAEAFGRSTVEYMMAGLLTIASDTGANKELINDKETGLLYTYGSAINLMTILMDINVNREKNALIASAGNQSARNTFNAKNNAEGVYKIYEEMHTLNER